MARAEKVSLKIVEFCGEEVDRQQDYPRMVYPMIDGWLYAMSMRGRISGLTANFIESIGTRVHPENNRNGYRQCGVRVGDRICPEPKEVSRLMERWAEMSKTMTPEEAYKEFQMIHPFLDGNGRVGKIIYNWLKGTLDNPQMPPNFFGCANP